MQEIKLREIVSFANQEEFHDLLLDRLHGAIHRVLDIEEGDYTMFMVTIPRGQDVEINPFLQQEQLIYGGVDAEGGCWNLACPIKTPRPVGTTSNTKSSLPKKPT